MNKELKRLIKLRSEELNKPKAKNLRRDENGNIIDHRQPRDEKLIRKLHKQINEIKNG